jgi:Flp pilus assembly pilin Flp
VTFCQCSVDGENIKSKRRINTMMELLKRFVKQEEGQDLVEYALLLVFLALAAIAVLPVLGKAVNNVFSQSASSLTAGS